MREERRCGGCGHPLRFSDNEGGHCEKILDGGQLCGHFCRDEDEDYYFAGHNLHVYHDRDDANWYVWLNTNGSEADDGLCIGAGETRSEAVAAASKSLATGLGFLKTEPGRPEHADEPQPPLRFCVRDQQPIDPKKVMRGSAFCSTECRRADMKERRAFRASKACRLCGRKARPKPTPKPPEAVCDSSTANPATENSR